LGLQYTETGQLLLSSAPDEERIAIRITAVTRHPESREWGLVYRHADDLTQIGMVCVSDDVMADMREDGVPLPPS
jgi:hypothetical protein